MSRRTKPTPEESLARRLARSAQRPVADSRPAEAGRLRFRPQPEGITSSRGYARSSLVSMIVSR